MSAGGDAERARVAVIGLGYFAQLHLDAWAADPRAELVAVADTDAGRAAEVGAARGVPSHADPEAMLAEAAPAIVDIVAPPAAHAGLVAAAAAPGRIVICQKPFCRTLEEARATQAAAQAAGAHLAIHENFRFQPWHRTVKALLDAGRLGEVWQARFALRPGDGRGAAAYAARQPGFREMERFLIRETGVHFVDLFRWFFGEVVAVSADLRRLNPAIRGEDAGWMALTHAGGVRSLFDGNRLADHATDDARRTMGEMEIEGAAGTLRLDGAGRLWLRPFGARAAEAVPLLAPVAEGVFGGGCVAAFIGHVLDHAHAPERIETPAADYLAVMGVVEAAYAAAETGRRVELGP